MKKELLIPVGEMASLYEAIHNGADAVYLGGKMFGARKFATNFNDDELVEAIKLCHLYGVKIYITVNTLIYESEIPEFINYVKFLYLNNVDAVIMQDIGMIKLVHELFPNLVIHASTQMHNHNQNNLKFLEQLGVKRVVLARELSIDEINKLDTNLEIEVFIHGALCICYSGQCLFSSLALNRSGNRGECAGLCRLPFKLLDNGGMVNTSGEYLLSPKEVCTISKFDELMKSNILSFKVEGRMKSPLYVGYITHLYRKLIDGLEVSVEEINNLLSIFNREFTLGHLFNQTNDKLINFKYPNHQGLEIGNVVDINKDYISIKLNHHVYQNDGIRFIESDKGLMLNYLYSNKELLINKGLKGEIIKVSNRIGLNSYDRVSLTTNTHLCNEFLGKNKKNIPISITVNARLNTPIEVIITDGINTVSSKGVLVDVAVTQPISKERLYEQINKVGEFPFIIENIDINMDDDIFIVIKYINEVRRKAMEELVYVRENKSYEHIINEETVTLINTPTDLFISALARTKDQIEACLESNVSKVYIDNYELYKEYKNYQNVYFRVPRVNYNIYEVNNALIGEIGSIYNYSNIVSDYFINATNTKTIRYLHTLGINTVCISPEVSINNLKLMNFNNLNTEIIVYGTLENMIMKHDLLTYSLGHEIDYDHKYHIKNNMNRAYLVEKDELGYTHIYNTDKINNINLINDYKLIGIHGFRLELLDEDYETTKKLINSINLTLF